MDDRMDLHQAVYGFLAAQLECGAYRFGDPLPRMEDVARWLSVSVDTVRAAHLRLKREGYITLTKKAGASVAVSFRPEELEAHIQAFFSSRRDAVMDLCRSLGPLFSRAQWFALKHASPEQLDQLELLCARPEAPPNYMMFTHIRLIYGSLNNGLLMRLIWHAFLFYQAPFLSLPENLAAFSDGDGPLLDMIGLCRRKDWTGLWRAVNAYHDRLASSIRRFYAERITPAPPGEAVSFHWSAYQKSSQLCYSLAIELLKGIRFGGYAQDGSLPSPAKIAEEQRVSISTVRRTLALLNQLGATRSINGVGTRALHPEDSAENCDFSQPVIQKRLLDFIQSLHILALTCKACAEGALAAMDPAAMEWYGNRLAAVRQSGRYESVVFASLEVIPRYSPNHAVRVVYEQLLHMLLWGYPLRSMHGSREEINAYYLPPLSALADCAAWGDRGGLAAELEELLLYEFRFALGRLGQLGVKEALMIPEFF